MRKPNNESWNGTEHPTRKTSQIVPERDRQPKTTSTKPPQLIKTRFCLSPEKKQYSVIHLKTRDLSIQRTARKHLAEALSSTFQTLPAHSKCSTAAETIAEVLDAAQASIAASYEAAPTRCSISATCHFLQEMGNVIVFHMC